MEEDLMFAGECIPNRRNFLKGSVGLAFGLSTFTILPGSVASAENAWIVGPQPGFSPEIGTLTSMLAFTREQVLHNVKGFVATGPRFPTGYQSEHDRRYAAASRSNRNLLSAELFWRDEMGFMVRRDKEEVGYPYESWRARTQSDQ